MFFETERLILRPWQTEDAEDLFRYASDDRVGPPAGWSPHASREQSREVLTEILMEPGSCAVVPKTVGHAVGSISITRGEQGSFPLAEEEAELGFWIGVPYWGQGYIPEAAKRLIAYCFEELALERVVCYYYDGNDKSRRAQEKCGFVYSASTDGHPNRVSGIVTAHKMLLTREAWQRGQSPIRAQLLALRDEAYRNFNRRLLPSLEGERIIGIRTPTLRSLARVLFATEEAECFMHELPHVYFEENQLHAFLIERIRDFHDCLAALEAFLPTVDNWATCDGLNPRVLGKHPEALLGKIEEWLASPHPYTKRYAIRLLMKYFLGERYTPAYSAAVASMTHEDYYVGMMQAWYFAELAACRYEEALPFFEERRLPPRVHGKAIQKACESLKIPDEHKQILRSLR